VHLFYYNKGRITGQQEGVTKDKINEILQDCRKRNIFDWGYILKIIIREDIQRF
jgi:hypothetical protein